MSRQTTHLWDNPAPQPFQYSSRRRTITSVVYQHCPMPNMGRVKRRRVKSLPPLPSWEFTSSWWVSKQQQEDEEETVDLEQLEALDKAILTATRVSDPSTLLLVGNIERDLKISPRPRASMEIPDIPPLKKKGSGKSRTKHDKDKHKEDKTLSPRGTDSHLFSIISPRNPVTKAVTKSVSSTKKPKSGLSKKPTKSTNPLSAPPAKKDLGLNREGSLGSKDQTLQTRHLPREDTGNHSNESSGHQTPPESAESPTGSPYPSKLASSEGKLSSSEGSPDELRAGRRPSDPELGQGQRSSPRDNGPKKSLTVTSGVRPNLGSLGLRRGISQADRTRTSSGAETSPEGSLTGRGSGSYGGSSKPVWMSRPSGSGDEELVVPMVSRSKSRPSMGTLFKDPPPEPTDIQILTPRARSATSPAGSPRVASSPRTKLEPLPADPPTVSPEPPSPEPGHKTPASEPDPIHPIMPPLPSLANVGETSSNSTSLPASPRGGTSESSEDPRALTRKVSDYFPAEGIPEDKERTLPETPSESFEKKEKDSFGAKFFKRRQRASSERPASRPIIHHLEEKESHDDSKAKSTMTTRRDKKATAPKKPPKLKEPNNKKALKQKNKSDKKSGSASNTPSPSVSRRAVEDAVTKQPEEGLPNPTVVIDPEPQVFNLPPKQPEAQEKPVHDPAGETPQPPGEPKVGDDYIHLDQLRIDPASLPGTPGTPGLATTPGTLTPIPGIIEDPESVDGDNSKVHEDGDSTSTDSAENTGPKLIVTDPQSVAVPVDLHGGVDSTEGGDKSTSDISAAENSENPDDASTGPAERSGESTKEGGTSALGQSVSRDKFSTKLKTDQIHGPKGPSKLVPATSKDSRRGIFNKKKDKDKKKSGEKRAGTKDEDSVEASGETSHPDEEASNEVIPGQLTGPTNEPIDLETFPDSFEEEGRGEIELTPRNSDALIYDDNIVGTILGGTPESLIRQYLLKGDLHYLNNLISTLDYWTNLDRFLDVLIDHATHYLKFRESLSGSVLSLDAEKVSHHVFDPEGARKQQQQRKEQLPQPSSKRKDTKTKDKHKSGPTGATPPKGGDETLSKMKRNVNNKEFRAKNKPRLVCQRILEVAFCVISFYFGGILQEEKNMAKFETFLQLLGDGDKGHIRRVLNRRNAGVGDPIKTVVLIRRELGKVEITGEELRAWFHTKGLSNDHDCKLIILEILSSGAMTSSSPSLSQLFSSSMKFTSDITPEQILLNRAYSFFPASSPSDVNFMTFKPLAFARAMALIEFQLFKAVQIHEINFWMKGDKNQRQLYAPNLFRLTNFVNSITMWVATEIVTTANAKIRQRVIQHFIDIAKCCADIKNYDGVLEIVGGLTHNSVDRMKSTWLDFKKNYAKTWAQYQEILEIVDPNNNWANLRKEANECLQTNTVYVPYLGVWTKDLTFINDGPAGGPALPKGCVAWPKQCKLAAILTQIRNLQKYQWSSQQINVKILQYIEVSLYMKNEKDLYATSKATEPSTNVR